MERKIIAVLLVATMIISLSAAGTAAPGSTTQKIEFKFVDYGGCSMYDAITGDYTTVPASAVLTGNIKKDRGGTLYLSPLKGMITIDGAPQQITVNQPKQSDPVVYSEYEWRYECTYGKSQDWSAIMDVSLGGAKYTGWLSWDKYHSEDYCGGNVYDDSYSYLSFQGVVDGKMASCWLQGEFPKIS